MPKHRHYKVVRAGKIVKSLGVVRIDGHDYYTGKYGSREAEQEYHRLLAEHYAGTLRPPTKKVDRNPLTVGELIGKFTRHRVTPYYVKDNKPTGEVGNMKAALRWVEEAYGDLEADKFGPHELKVVRAAMMQVHARTTINRNVVRVRQVFRWAVSEGLYPPASLVALEAVDGLPRGRTAARETKGVRPADPAAVAAAIPYMPERVGTIVRLIELTGARPGEICNLRASEIDRSRSIWEYRPSSHKTQHHGRDRVILLGPKAQGVLRPWIAKPDTDAYCFCPADAIANQGWQGKRRPKANSPYNTTSLGKAIKSACRRAQVPAWHPNQLRHLAATVIRKRFGLESSRAILGHSKASTTEIYAEMDLERAREIMGEIG